MEAKEQSTLPPTVTNQPGITQDSRKDIKHKSGVKKENGQMDERQNKDKDSPVQKSGSPETGRIQKTDLETTKPDLDPDRNTSSPFAGIEVLQFLMPGLCHLSAEDSARQILMTTDFPQLLYDYILYQWERRKAGEPSAANKQPLVTMTTTCGVILNVVVLEAQEVEYAPAFREIFCFACMVLDTLSGRCGFTPVVSVTYYR